MKRTIGIVSLCVLFSSQLFARSGDTNVFRLRLLPETEVPAVPLAGASADATVTLRVTRNGQGAIDSATVTFDVTYAMPVATTFTGLHIHNAQVGVNGPVVINSGLTVADGVTGTTGRIARTVDFTSADAIQLGWVEGVLASPDLYYVNLHSTVNPSGVVRAQLQPHRVTFRPALLPENEVPAITDLDAVGSAAVTVQVERDAAGEIVSGTVTFEVDYRFGSGVTLTGLHIHRAAAGVNGPVVINSGVNSTGPIDDSDGSGSLFRVATVGPTDTNGLATLNALLSDPGQFYVNLHTTINPSGAIRGQLDTNSLSFLSGMTGAEEFPPVAAAGTASSLITVSLNRDGSGNISGGIVVFDVDYSFSEATTLTGLHIHNEVTGSNGPVRINSGLGGSNAIVDPDGSGTILLQADIGPTDSLAIVALNGLAVAPELYYVNLHSIGSPSGLVRAQLAYEAYHFDASMSPSNEVPPVNSTATGTAWMSVLVKRDGNGTITSGSVGFDVDFAVGEAATITGLHVHRGNHLQGGPVVVSSGIGGVMSTSGSGNVSSIVEVGSNDTAGLNTLADIVSDPKDFYVNLHTSVHPAGLMRAQLLETSSFVSQIAGGGGWITSLTVTNSSDTESVEGIAQFFDTAGMPLPGNIIDPGVPFRLPPSGSVTLNAHNQGGGPFAAHEPPGTLTSGFARIDSDGAISTQVQYLFPGLASSGANLPVTASAVSAAVSVGGGDNVGVAVLSLDGANIRFILRDTGGAVVGSAIRTLGARGYYAAFLSELFPAAEGSSLSGTIEIESRRGIFQAGSMSVIALQFGPGTLDPVAVSPN